MKKLVILLIAILLFTQLGQSKIEINDSDISFTIDSMKTNVTLNDTSNFFWNTELLIRNNHNEIDELSFEFRADLKNLHVRVNGTPNPSYLSSDNGISSIQITLIESFIHNQTLVINMNAELLHDLKEIDNNVFQFLFDWYVDKNVRDVQFSLILPSGMFIFERENKLSIFPNTDNIETDGRRLILVWDNLTLESLDDNTSVLVEFSNISGQQVSSDKSLIFYVILVFFLILSLLSLSYKYWQIKKKLSEIEEKTPESEVKITRVVKPMILSPKELNILKVIHEYDGSILQSDLIDILGVSKSRVSQYISEFVRLGIVSKMKKGRLNYVILEVDLELIN